MSAIKSEKWIDINHRKVCIKLSQQYYSAKEAGKKFKVLRMHTLALIFKRIFFLLIELIRLKRAPGELTSQKYFSRSFFKNLLGLYSFEVPGLLPQQPLLQKLNFKQEVAPMVSIIIAVHNHLDYTYNCLLSILLKTQNISYEIIIVNDCSSDGTSSYLKGLENIVYLENNENIGFLKSCNKAADFAKGKYLCFLNNDTQVTQDWLFHMISVFKSDQQTGLVGVKLIYPYGLLQEAGGLVNYLGQTANYGKYTDPSLGKYNYLRETDYCSGACILVEKADFDKLNGFDTRYIPAYYEDTDLAFAIRYQLNKKVFYQPLTEIIHFEGISSGKTIVAGSVKEYQLVNSKKFIEKWYSVIERFPKTTIYEKIADKFR